MFVFVLCAYICSRTLYLLYVMYCMLCLRIRVRYRLLVFSEHRVVVMVWTLLSNQLYKSKSRGNQVLLQKIILTNHLWNYHNRVNFVLYKVILKMDFLSFQTYTTMFHCQEHRQEKFRALSYNMHVPYVTLSNSNQVLHQLWPKNLPAAKSGISTSSLGVYG